MRLPLNVQFSVKYNEDKALKSVPKILANELKKTMKSIGDRLTLSAEKRMRRDRGESARSLRTELSGSAYDVSYSVEVYSTLLKAFVDAYGLRPGKMPPSGFGTSLRAWAVRKARGVHSERVKGLTTPYAGHGPHRVFKAEATKVQGVNKLKNGRIPKRVTKVGKVKRARMRADRKAASSLAYLTARNIFERGLRASNWNRKALEANRRRIINDLQNAMSRTVNRVNRG